MAERGVDSGIERGRGGRACIEIDAGGELVEGGHARAGGRPLELGGVGGGGCSVVGGRHCGRGRRCRGRRRWQTQTRDGEGERPREVTARV